MTWGPQENLTQSVSPCYRLRSTVNREPDTVAAGKSW